MDYGAQYGFQARGLIDGPFDSLYILLWAQERRTFSVQNQKQIWPVRLAKEGNSNEKLRPQEVQVPLSDKTGFKTIKERTRAVIVSDLK